MIESIIVDTSVWIDFFQGNETEGVQLLCTYLEKSYPIFICPTIIQEVLQGIKNDEEFELVRSHLFALKIVNDDAVEVALGAADIYRRLRKKRITIRKSNDCCIAYYAIKYSLKIIHRDRDFDSIISHYPTK